MSNPDWQEALARLKYGNDRFCDDSPNGELRDSKRRKVLAHGQNPFAIVLTCSDSRVVPELIFDTGLGELFTVRVAGNIANAASIASIEYAVANLGSRFILVMGHESCGAVAAAIDGSDAGKNLNHLLNFVQPAVEGVDDAEIDIVARSNVLNTAKTLVQESEIIRSAVNRGQVKIGTAFYHLGSGRVDFDEGV